MLLFDQPVIREVQMPDLRMLGTQFVLDLPRDLICVPKAAQPSDGGMQHRVVYTTQGGEDPQQTAGQDDSGCRQSAKAWRPKVGGVEHVGQKYPLKLRFGLV